MNTKNSRALRAAHYIQNRKGPWMPWRDCVAHGWYFENFRQWLTLGVVNFSYWKRDGTIRDANGTTNLKLIPREHWPKDNNPFREPVASAVPYYDIDKQAWRSFEITNFIGFVTIWELKELPKQED